MSESTRRSRGRPPIAKNERSFNVCVRLPERAYGKLVALSNKHPGRSVSSVLRSIVILRLSGPDADAG